MRQDSQRGVALVITLIMLSVITVIVVAFLAVSRRERASVAQSISYQDTQRMAETALARANGEILADIMANSNFLGPDFLVSQNVDGVIDWRNGLYNLSTIGNLQYEPRAPVFVKTNRNGSTEFRFWLDLDRNGLFSDTGFLPVVESSGSVFKTNGVEVIDYQRGDPQWVGLLANPRFPHSRTNRFVGRYAYMVLPVGRSLDLNFIHNNAKQLRDSFRDVELPGFMRNQGVGSWEVNLAAFLADLNTNVWGFYQYNVDSLTASAGLSFTDASELLSYRYDGNFGFLDRMDSLFFPGASLAFETNLIDDFANGPIAPLNTVLSPFDEANDLSSQTWPGSDSRNHFFTVHDFWDRARQPNYSNFISRLELATLGRSTYDQTTYYRMLSELGTDSAPEEEQALQQKINLTYNNKDLATTNLVEWTGLEFFTNVADKFLREEFGFETGNIPVYTNGSSRALDGNRLYSPRVHQLLQIAANLTDARRADQVGEIYPYYPSVFRPRMDRIGNDIYISGFTEELGPAQVPSFRSQVFGGQMKWWDLDDPTTWPAGTLGPTDNFYGIPLVVGARKGFPNFNEFSMMTVVQVGRKLEFRKRDVNDNSPNQTNQMFTVGISNVFGVEAWNSYQDPQFSPYPRPLELVVANVMTTTLTNDGGVRLTTTTATNYTTVYNAGSWSGGLQDEALRSTPQLAQVVLPDSVYYLSPTPHFEPVGFTNRFERNQGVYTNRWGLTVTNKLLFFLFDNGRVVDAVAMSDLNTYFNISEELSGGTTLGEDFITTSAVPYDEDFWSIEPYANINAGVRNQIQTSLGNINKGVNWESYGGLDPAAGQDRGKAIDGFRYYMNKRLSMLFGNETNDLPPLSTVHQAPFTPLRKMFQLTEWQVNDPLVHYTVEDVRGGANATQVRTLPTPKSSTDLNQNYNLGHVNRRYKPWGREKFLEITGASANDVLSSVKDPRVGSSDDWNFPTNQFPNIGWMGRVHRGTPWQTIYLKSSDVALDRWQEQVGGAFILGTNLLSENLVGMLTSPTNDWRLADMFTVAPHPNASRGTLSVNQEGLAAWSAVLSGVTVTTLRQAGAVPFRDDAIIEPAAVESPVAEIVEGINRQRALMPRQRFESLGQLLATPELTEASPYLRAPYMAPALDNPAVKEATLRDEDYERIPQQVLSLLKLGDARFVVYAFGQALKPAPSSILSSGPSFGVCTNYQITGESAIRAVVRVDFDPVPIADPLDPNFGKPDVLRPHAMVESYNIVPIE